MFAYLFVSLWALLFGVGMTFMFSDSGLIRIFDEVTDSTYLNTAIFLAIGLLAFLYGIYILFFTYWVKSHDESLIIRNLFRSHEITWVDIKDIHKLKWVPVPQLSVIKTLNGQTLYIHVNTEELIKKLEHQISNVFKS